MQAFGDLLTGKGDAANIAEIGTNLIIRIMEGVESGVKTVIDPVINAIETIFSKLPIDKLAATGAKLIGSLVKAAAKIMRGGGGIIQQIAPELISAIPIFVGALLSSVDLGEVIKAFVFMNMDLFAEILPDLFDAAAQAIPELVFIILNGLAEAAPTIVTAFVDAFWNIFSGISRLIIEVVKEIVPLIWNTLVSLLAGLASLISGAVEGIIGNIARIPETIKNVFNGNMSVSDAMNSFGDWWGGAIDGGISAMDSFGDWAGNTRNKLTFDFDGDYTKPVAPSSDRGGLTMGDINMSVNVPNTNASPDEIGDAVAEAISVALEEFANRKGAAHGTTPVMAR